jgi:asparagine synthase (glutamine-hydrolysing)
MRSDVPMGITLSSGLDSNSILYAMNAADPRPHKCYTSRFRESDNLPQDRSVFTSGGDAVDEAVVARRVANTLKSESHVVDTNYDDLVDDMSEIIRHLESGNSSPAVLPLMQLLKVAATDVTVVMDGQGADELLGGYITAVIWQSVMGSIRRGKILEAWRGVREFSRTYTLKGSLVLAVRYMSNRWPLMARLHQRTSGLDAVYGPRLRGHAPMSDFPDMSEVEGETWLRWTLRHQHAGGLVNLLHYGDAISMANSIEARTPFLDHRLVEFCWRLPDDFMVRGGVGKIVHREAMRGLVPDDIIDNRAKHGFTTPISQRLRMGAGEEGDPLNILLNERCLSRKIFRQEGLAALISDHRAGKADHGPLLFRLLSTELWFREFVDNRPVDQSLPVVAVAA